MRTRTGTLWGWNAELAAKVAAPTLIMVGEFDSLFAPDQMLYADLTGISNKAFIGVDCASHLMTWEKQRQVLHEASLEWLDSRTINGQRQGIFKADFPDGRITSVGP